MEIVALIVLGFMMLSLIPLFILFYIAIRY
jgi:hypothetical protein